MRNKRYRAGNATTGAEARGDVRLYAALKAPLFHGAGRIRSFSGGLWNSPIPDQDHDKIKIKIKVKVNVKGIGRREPHLWRLGAGSGDHIWLDAYSSALQSNW
jgi:hypothetical protein